MREVHSEEITKNIKEMCIEANHFLSPDMKKVFDNARKNEKSPLGCQILEQLDENLKIAGEDMIPICQDTGMAVVFIEIGQDVHIVGENIEDAINQGVREGYVDGFLRKSVVKDPILRENTKDNTPAVIHYSIVPGENVKITIAPKGFGSENMGKIKELLIKYKELVLYVVFGVLTTVVSYVSYWIFTDFLHIPYMVSTALSWVLSVTFAYVTNRKWVFESRAHGFVPILTEAAKFFASRIASGFMEMGMMFIGVDLLHVNDKIVKLVANVFVILANYILSKLVVFRKKK